MCGQRINVLLRETGDVNPGSVSIKQRRDVDLVDSERYLPHLKAFTENSHSVL